MTKCKQGNIKLKLIDAVNRFRSSSSTLINFMSSIFRAVDTAHLGLGWPRALR